MSNFAEGTAINLGGVSYIVPALSFGQLKRFKGELEKLGEITGLPTDEQMDSVCRVVHAAVSRNYPAVTLESIEDLIDLRNAGMVVKSIMGQSGLTPDKGEAPAVN